ncbi:MAG: tRNA (guanosine(37)-N1)-methyltransferase TrmD [Candidatus Marinimicrobia bacterium]|jgi:tRNA (guanine37-N1)-methyltransferase|nr:tRNA (guanosine(37)-N1)-methyltransferase TrmD [Candidatus Neomarinimicrobiota bacterium]MBT3575369.1 tRNA (guanosine(37)-N1)-methyltransferase TrmD [Candidatus Neomarinimicrobiota bacterium]MBT3680716.1 tRNA (guanosine(37)-N1)-methyltransferase TrmD [Candidatus Neomarinimicrobiota bacterium]MBT3950140.1 tRNA (guanosine(37)-N1)-methyltransferase TrmD [Candidatus Neomarinimicrobiota bacterium]MBT4253800.1 tRNA (guanosine(37)-N1)-methyltransferase TrmD [Candidatus Neomarinimicrobiota bacterium
MIIDVITTFPETLNAFREMGIVGRAFENGLAEMKCWDIRDFADDTYKHIDDVPYGGGAGMIIKPDPLFRAFEAVAEYRKNTGHRIFLTPQGKPFQQDDAERLVETPHLVLLCGRYKGIDQRVRDELIDEEISLGDFVLSGGEIAAFAVIDAMVRLLPGAVSDDESTKSDTFPVGLLDAPYYTRPAEYRGIKVPDVLLSGHHAQIENWREQQRLERTKVKRPDLFDRYMRGLEESNEQSR